MSNVIAFPETKPTSGPLAGIFDEARVRAYAERHAQEHPERILEMNVRLRLASKTAELLHNMIEEIRTELDA